MLNALVVTPDFLRKLIAKDASIQLFLTCGRLSTLKSSPLWETLSTDEQAFLHYIDQYDPIIACGDLSLKRLATPWAPVVIPGYDGGLE